MASSRSGRGRRVRFGDMDEVSTAEVRSSDVLIGKLSPEERERGEDMLYSVRKAKGVLSAEEVGAALGVDASLVEAVWRAQ